MELKIDMIKLNTFSILYLFLIVFTFSLISCGGGGGDDDDNGDDGGGDPMPTLPAPFEDFGSIRGSVESSGGNDLNAIHVRAVNIDNPNIQISAFSGINEDLEVQDGFFQIDRIPPGDYKVLIERLDARDGGGGVFADTRYSDFVEAENPFIAFPDEYFNGNNESDDDDPMDFVIIEVEEGLITTGVDFITNN